MVVEAGKQVQDLFSRYSYSTQVLMPWIWTFMYAGVSLAVISLNWREEIDLGQKMLVLLLLVFWTLIHFWLQGWVFWRRLIGVVVILALIAGYLAWRRHS